MPIDQTKDKKQILYMLYVIMIIAVCILPFILIFIMPENETYENRKLAEFPSVYADNGTYNFDFLSELGTYFEDHFAFRNMLVSINSKIRAGLFSTSPNDDVIVGKNGWLYYSATVDDYTHFDPLSERKLFNIAHNIKLMQTKAENSGSSFVFTIAPNKNTLYPENMPESYIVDNSKTSDLDRLAPYLEAGGVNYVNLKGLFLSQNETLYLKRDSHWNKKGAVLAYNAMLDAAGKSHETYDGILPRIIHSSSGDLNKMLYPVLSPYEEDMQYDKDYTWEYSGEADDVTDPVIFTTSKTGTGKLLMYRDSFGNSLIDIMAEEFSEACFSKNEPYALSDIAKLKPDVFIIEKVERHLPSLSSVAPLMDADKLFDVREYYESLAYGEEDIENDYAFDEITATHADAYITAENGFIKLSGTVDLPNAATDMRILAEISSDGDVGIYEAFCTSDKESDFNYALYFSPERLGIGENDMLSLLEGDAGITENIGIRIIISDNDGCRAVYENEQIKASDADINKNCEEIKNAIIEKKQKELEEARKAEEARRKAEEERKRLEEQKKAEEEAKAIEEEQNKKAKKTNSSGAYEVSRVYYEDCGADTGYWEITWSDGSVTYVDD